MSLMVKEIANLSVETNLRLFQLRFLTRVVSCGENQAFSNQSKHDIFTINFTFFRCLAPKRCTDREMPHAELSQRPRVGEVDWRSNQTPQCWERRNRLSALGNVCTEESRLCGSGTGHRTFLFFLSLLIRFVYTLRQHNGGSSFFQKVNLSRV